MDLENLARPPDPSLIGHIMHRCGFVGSIHTNRDEYYEFFRQVENQACNVLFPLVIVRPVSTRDVAIGVKVAKDLGLEIRSVKHISFSPLFHCKNVCFLRLVSGAEATATAATTLRTPASTLTSVGWTWCSCRGANTCR